MILVTRTDRGRTKTKRGSGVGGRGCSTNIQCCHFSLYGKYVQPNNCKKQNKKKSKKDNTDPCNLTRLHGSKLLQQKRSSGVVLQKMSKRRMIWMKTFYCCLHIKKQILLIIRLFTTDIKTELCCPNQKQMLQTKTQWICQIVQLRVGKNVKITHPFHNVTEGKRCPDENKTKH